MEDDTDFKLGKLKSSMPEADMEMLLEVLISCNGNLFEAKQLLGLEGGNEADHNDFYKALDGPPSPLMKEDKLRHQVTLKRFMGADCDESLFNIKRQRVEEKGKTLHIYDPDDVEKLLPCTMHLNIFPKELANSVLKFLLKDSESWPQTRSFYMFNKLVTTAHTSGFYTDNHDIYAEKKATYNGAQVKDTRLFNKDMSEAKKIVEKVVNQQIKKRGLMPFQYPHKWQTDVALCNRYDGPKESVGYHSDQLTHLGPHCVIASISLGVTREFRLKSRINKNASPISVHLPHNSLIIMHAGCQEDYKHTLMPSFGKPLDLHPIAGATRINITYRMYLDSFSADNIPKCKCNKPMILRVATNSKAGQSASSSAPAPYIWLCGGSYSEHKECGHSIFPRFPINKSTEFGYRSVEDGEEITDEPFKKVPV